MSALQSHLSRATSSAIIVISKCAVLLSTPTSRSLAISVLIVGLICGCKPNNNATLETDTGRVVHTGGMVLTPLGSQPVAAQWSSDISNGTAVQGATTSFSGITGPDTAAYNAASAALGYPFTSLPSTDDRMPAYWNVEWIEPSNCLSTDPPYGPLPNPVTFVHDFEPTSAFSTVGPNFAMICVTNSVLNPDFIPTNVSPQFVLDDAIPATISVASFLPIQAANSITNLRVFDTNLTNPANVTAISVGPNGSSATFPYPTQSNGASLPAGAYITTITTDPSNGPQTTNGMEPFYIGHDDTSFTGAFGSAIATPTKVTTVTTGTKGEFGECLNPKTTTTTTGGNPLPLVTLLTQNELAIGSMSNLRQVGANPTVVLAFHDIPESVNTGLFGPGGSCNTTLTFYSGAQSALVVNTGGNSISIVEVGSYLYPSGTVSVGNQPVAAAINPAETMAYIANYQDGTVSEVSLSTLSQTRTIAVMAHPSSVTFDNNGNLWVGGQGSLMNINISNWAVASTTAIDGTVNGMSYDAQQSSLVQTVLQNGSAAAPPNNGSTMSAQVSFSASPLVSYTTQSNFNLSTMSASAPVPIFSDNAIYTNSSIAPYLAFAGQTAFSPAIYTSSNGDLTATATGTTFTISVISTGQVLIQGTLPYPARSVTLSPNMVYFTMPESNSLVSMPIVIP
jgi:YVTN family beta-propeller protein